MTFLSDLATNLQESATLAMSRTARELKEQGKDIINLSLGEPNFPTPDYICQSAIKAIESKQYFSYPPVAGYTDVREAIAEKLSKENRIAAMPEQVVVSTGAKQSIANALLATLNPGDEVVIPSPYWVTYPELVRFVGATPVHPAMSIKEGFKLQAESLRQAFTSRTKMLIFSSPSNPTGACLDEEHLSKLVEVLVDYPQVLVLSDEIYEYIRFQGKHASIASFESMAHRTLTVNGLSKGFAMTGWRLGYMHAPQPIARACEKIQGQFTSGANAIAQRCILSALQHDKQACYRMRDAYHQRANYAYERLSKIAGIEAYVPQGAYYMFPDVHAFFHRRTPAGELIQHADALCMYLLKEAGLAVLSGVPFGDPHCIRLSFGLGEEKLKEALDRLEKALLALEA